jgi:hypothetical protein
MLGHSLLLLNNSPVLARRSLTPADWMWGQSAEEVAAEAAAQLPPEPPTGEGATRLAVRLPDGKRMQRRFLRSDPLQVVHTWCISECLEAAGGRAFQLVPGGLGAPSLPLRQQCIPIKTPESQCFERSF